MTTAIHRVPTLNQVLGILKRPSVAAVTGDRPIMEQLIYGVLREGATREQADRAYRNLTERFFDWNEVRVSQPGEVEAALEKLPGAAAKAPRVIGLLQSVFEEYFSFSMEEIAKKGLRNAVKQLQDKVPDATDFAIAWVVQHSLGGHAIPLDEPALRALNRLGVTENDSDLESLRAGLEHHIPKAKGPIFAEALSVLAADYCWTEEPHCSACPLRSDCPTGQERPAESRSTRLKPR
jgi:endonuclease-3